MSNENTMTAVENLTAKIDAAMSIFADVDTLAENLQPVLVDILKACKAVNHKKTVKESPDVRRLFERQHRGLDRAKLIAWFEEFSPLRIIMDGDTGRFKTMGWDKTKDGQADQWNIAGAEKCEWWNATGKIIAKTAKTGEIAAARKALAKTIVRKAVAESGGYDRASLEKVIDTFKESFFAAVMSDANDYIMGESFDEWLSAWEEKQAAEKAKEEKAAKKKAEPAPAKIEPAKPEPVVTTKRNAKRNNAAASAAVH